MATYWAKAKACGSPEELSDVHLWCQLHGHDWDDAPEYAVPGKEGTAQHTRKDHVCERDGCGCTLGYWIDSTGSRWGFKRGYTDWYRLRGGWTHDDLRAEVLRREKGGVQIKPRRKKLRLAS
jgi:hypothetical protein